MEGFCYGRKDKVLVLLHQVEIDGFIGDSQDTLSFGCRMAAKALERDKSATSQAIVELAVCLSDCRIKLAEDADIGPKEKKVTKSNKKATKLTPKKRDSPRRLSVTG